MACLKIDAPELSLPGFSIPTISTPPISIGVGVDFCCTYEISKAIPPIPIPLGSIPGAGGVAAVAAAVMLAAANTLDSIHDAMQEALDQFQIPKCPFQE